MNAILGNAYLAVGGILLGVLLIGALITAAFFLLGGKKRPFLLGFVFASAHVLVVALVAYLSPSDLTSSPLAGIGWLFLCVADFPATLLFPRSSTGVSLAGFFLVFGTLQQGVAGTFIAALYSLWRRKEPHTA